MEGTRPSHARDERPRKAYQWNNKGTEARELGTIDLSDENILRDFWYTQLPPNSDPKQCGVKKYHIGFDGESARDAAEVEDLRELGESAGVRAAQPSRHLRVCPGQKEPTEAARKEAERRSEGRGKNG